MKSKYTSFLVTMKPAEAAAFVKFAKNVSATAVRRTAENPTESVLMQVAIDRLLNALKEVSCGLPDTALGQPCLDTEQAAMLLNPIIRSGKKSRS